MNTRGFEGERNIIMYISILYINRIIASPTCEPLQNVISNSYIYMMNDSIREMVCICKEPSFDFPLDSISNSFLPGKLGTP